MDQDYARLSEDSPGYLSSEETSKPENRIPEQFVKEDEATPKSSGEEERRCTKKQAIQTVVGLGALILVIAIFSAFVVHGTSLSSCRFDISLKVKETSADSKPIATNGEPFPWEDLLLPTHIEPVSYDLFMWPDIPKSKFSGKVIIEIKVKKQTDFTVFHVKELNVTEVKLVSADLSSASEEIKVTETLEYTTHQQFYLKFEKELLPQTNYFIHLNFSGELKADLVGFYKSSYNTTGADGSEETRYIATTQFEPTDARKAFPCYDEPSLKAKFQMKMVRGTKQISLFNMPLVKTEPYMETSDLKLDIFNQSVKMSTYLVAFVVCDFEFISNLTAVEGAAEGVVNVSVYAPADQLSQTQYALSAGTTIISYYSEYFGVPYPLPKQDMIAIPDFAAGAMENWGLITYRETAILYQEGVTSTKDQQWVATVVAHELAHQWFGNLVTMKWWNDLWLNEGFASYVEFKGADKVNPDFQMMDQFILDNVQPALHIDSYTESHPISVEVNDPDEINEIFDEISYDKGSSIIRMLNTFMDTLGGNKFHQGLTDYLSKYKYSNAETDDLWQSLSEASDGALNVKEMMDSWTLQMGYPMVSLARKKSDVISVKQEKFFLNYASSDDNNYSWYVPLTYFTDVDKSKGLLMNKTGAKFNINKDSKWIKANSKQNGFYRVNYDKDNWQALIDQLLTDHSKIDAADRSNLLDDAFSLARAEKLSELTAWEMSIYLKKEEDYVPMLSGLVQLGDRSVMLRANTKGLDLIHKYILLILDKLIQDIGWDDNGPILKKYLRELVLKEAVLLGHEESVKTATEMFQEWMTDKKDVHPNLKKVVYCGGVRTGGDAEWEHCWEEYTKTLVPSEQKLLLYAMSCSTSPTRLKQYLEYSIDATKIRSQDTDAVIRYVASHTEGAVLSWEFFKKNYDLLFDRYGSGTFTFGRMIKSVADHFSSTEWYQDVWDFFTAHPDVGTGARAVKQTLEQICINSAWRKFHETEVVTWLAEYVQTHAA